MQSQKMNEEQSLHSAHYASMMRQMARMIWQETERAEPMVCEGLRARVASDLVVMPEASNDDEEELDIG